MKITEHTLKHPLTVIEISNLIDSDAGDIFWDYIYDKDNMDAEIITLIDWFIAAIKRDAYLQAVDDCMDFYQDFINLDAEQIRKLVATTDSKWIKYFNVLEDCTQEFIDNNELQSGEGKSDVKEILSDVIKNY